jgi:hypothetical protein
MEKSSDDLAADPDVSMEPSQVVCIGVTKLSHFDATGRLPRGWRRLLER